MSKRTQKRLPPKTKLAILKSHLQDRVKVSDLCQKHEISPQNIYTWQNQLFTNGEIVFERKNDRKTGAGAAKRNDDKIQALETKLTQKHEVISEMMEEIVKLKKSLGVI